MVAPLEGVRRASHGDVQGAIERWSAGIRFSQHLAAGGALLPTLVGTTALRSTLGAVERAAQAGTFGAVPPDAIREALAAVPDTGFDWSGAWRRDQASTLMWIAQLAADPAAFESATGQAGASRPRVDEITAYALVMERTADALTLPPDAAQPLLLVLDAERAALHPFLDGLIPSPQRTNETRAQIAAMRARVLALLE